MAKMEKLNELPDEIKVLIVNGQTLADKTKTNMNGRGLDMTCRFQLRDDCKAVEKYIKQIKKGKYSEKDVTALRLAIVRLQTSSDALIKDE